MINYDNLKAEAKADLYIDESSIISCSANNGIKVCKWLDYYKVVASELNYIKQQKDKIELALYLYYTGKANSKQLEALGKTKPFGLKIDTKSDIDRFIKASSEYIEVNQQLNETDNILKFIDEVIQDLKTQNFRITNIINYKRFSEGG